MFILRLLVPLQPIIKTLKIMTATAQQVKSTPMGPYIGLMRGMSRRDIQIVVTFLNEVMTEGPEEKATPPKTNEEIIREKYKNLKLSPEIQRLRGCMKLTEEEMQDERTKYILGL